MHNCTYILVSLLRECTQEIECMMMMYSTHGLFLTCTQKYCLYLNGIQIFNIHTVYKQSLSNHLQQQQRTSTFLEGQFLARGDKFPSTLVPSLVTTAPPLSLHHFYPLSTLDPHYTVYKDDINNHGLLCPGLYLSP
jgi:hypothetical protein